MFAIVVTPGTGTEEGLGALVAVIALVVMAVVLVAFAVWGFRQERRAERLAMDVDANEPLPLTKAGYSEPVAATTSHHASSRRRAPGLLAGAGPSMSSSLTAFARRSAAPA